MVSSVTRYKVVAELCDCLECLLLSWWKRWVIKGEKGGLLLSEGTVVEGLG